LAKRKRKLKRNNKPKRKSHW